MSKDAERKAMKDTLAAYTLMRVRELAGFLGCGEQHARDLLKAGKIPSVNIGLGTRPEYRVDPLDAAVWKLAGLEGITTEAYWELHGEATVDHAKRFMVRIRKLAAA